MVKTQNDIPALIKLFDVRIIIHYRWQRLKDTNTVQTTFNLKLADEIGVGGGGGLKAEAHFSPTPIPLFKFF